MVGPVTNDRFGVKVRVWAIFIDYISIVNDNSGGNVAILLKTEED